MSVGFQFGKGFSPGLVFWPVKIKKDQPNGQNWLKPGFIGQNWPKLVKICQNLSKSKSDEMTAKKWDLTITPTCLKVVYFPSMLIFVKILFLLKIFPKWIDELAGCLNSLICSYHWFITKTGYQSFQGTKINLLPKYSKRAWY